MPTNLNNQEISNQEISTGHGGARPGAGRKPRTDEKDLEGILKAAWPRGDRIKAVKKLAEQANVGDVGAAKLLLAYAYGNPRQTIEASVKLDVSVDDELDRKLAQLATRTGPAAVPDEPDASGAGSTAVSLGLLGAA